MAEQVATPVATPSPYVFEPPPGGDISFRSADGKLFCLHSVLLGLASSAFSDMFAVGTQSQDIIDLADDSEPLSLMLGFIYPSAAFPIVNTFELLEKSLDIAQKYHVTSMIQRIDRSMSHESFYKDFIKIDPLRLFKLCAEHGLRETQTTAARIVRVGPGDLLDPHGIIELAKQYPSSSHIIGLLGTQLIRVDILSLALLDTGEDSLLAVDVEDDKFDFKRLICVPCREICTQGDIVSSLTYYPGWLRAWGVLAYDTLTTHSWDDSAFVFTSGILKCLKFYHANDGFCRACVEAASNAGGGRTFEIWAARVKEDLETRMQELEDLYAL
ncbi:hypothetical protein BDV93DRAFT_521264 [Ceratobasidium sp. AG-I]|nr:hypothetical protein BDV93DRAFT_521264 [Ceratobasidium sp. AG-I]